MIVLFAINKNDSSFAYVERMCAGEGNVKAAPREKELDNDANLSVSLKAATKEEEEISAKAANIARPKMALFMFVLTAVRKV